MSRLEFKDTGKFNKDFLIWSERPSFYPEKESEKGFLQTVIEFLNKNTIDNIVESLKKEVIILIEKIEIEKKKKWVFIDFNFKDDNKAFEDAINKNYIELKDYFINMIEFLKNRKIESEDFFKFNPEKDFLKDLDIENITIKQLIKYIEISPRSWTLRYEFLFFLKNIPIENMKEFLNKKICNIIKKIDWIKM